MRTATVDPFLRHPERACKISVASIIYIPISLPRSFAPSLAPSLPHSQLASQIWTCLFSKIYAYNMVSKGIRSKVLFFSLEMLK